MTAYGTLGVGKDATGDEIKAAYRAKSKDTHPDAGGSHEAFAALGKAYALLNDPATRADYDRFGDAAGSVQSLRQQAETAVAAMVVDCCLKRDADRDDVWQLVLDMVGQIQAGVREQLPKLERQEAKLRRVAARFHAKHGGESPICRALEATAEQVSAQRKAAEFEIAKLEEVKGVLYDHTFDRPPPPQPSYSPFSNVDMARFLTTGM